ncbi:MAG: insulinase family protein [Gammaproteobacteria bacterium]|nr:insulinase family protein [Gammaproteobacteria bacterium]
MQNNGKTGVESMISHEAFESIGRRRIDSLNITVEEYRHKKTGALHYHLASENTENVFLVGFRTVPMDSTGVAHILEHTALCGSKNYPVRDPFFMMIRRSLNTFMNAFTSSDWTAYPFASKNKKDFNNLLDVYLDAVFFTRLDELDFLQEGHRVEFADPDNPESDLEFKGVVFNEMKGAMSSPVSVLWQTLSKYLYPSTTYHFNSGGEPADIPDLTYQQLKDFHKTHYHPSNAVFMTFGDIAAADHQRVFEERALAEFDRLDVHIAVDPEKRYLAPVSVEEAYAFDVTADETTDEKTHHVLSWLLGPCTSLDEMMKANLLSQVLLDNSSSPLRYALEKTELGTSPSPLCGLEDSNYEMCFVCGLEGSEVEHATDFEKLVLDVLEDVAENGVAHDKLESVLHQLEISQREIGGDGYPFGLQLILGGLTAAIHRSDPTALLDLDPVIESLRKDIEDPEFIKQLVRKYLLDNPHRVRLTLRPNTELSQRKEMAEKQRLAAMKAAMSDEDRQLVVMRAAELAQRQQQVDDPEILPKVGLEDVPPELSIPESQQRKIAGTDSFLYAQGTNGLVYHELAIDMPALSDAQIRLIPYYSSCLTELGCGDDDYLKMQELQSSVSGGIQAHSSIQADITDVQSSNAYFMFMGKALNRNNAKLASLMHDTMNTVRFDEHDRIKDLISQQRARRERSVTGSGHTLAMTAAASGMSPVAALSHRFGGLEGIRFIKQLDDANNGDNAAQSIAELAEGLASIHQQVLTSPRRYMMTAESDKLDALVRQFEKVWTPETADSSFTTFSLDENHQQVKQMWVANTQVNFCAKAFPTVPMDHEDSAALAVLGGFLRNGYLHTSIREKGGAYGGGATHDSSNAAFKFYSYRDPRLAETLDDFDRSIDWMLNNEHEWRQVEEAILGVIGTMDKPGSPSGEARHAFHNNLHGRTREKLQLIRQRVLAVTLDDLKRVTETYLQPDRASTAVITSAATHEQVGDMGLEVINL